MERVREFSARSVLRATTRSVLLALLLPATLLPASAASAGSGTAVSATAVSAAPRLSDQAPCTEVAGFTCGYLSVPLDRGRPRAGTLRLRVAVADDVEAPRGVLLVLTGGPGQPGPGLAPRVVPRLEYLRSEYRLVLIDQRGTGEGAIDCPGLQNQVGSSDVLAPSPDAVAECAALLGTARNFYTTADTVADLDDLRRALGIRSWTLDGVSYGTFVAQRYALQYPGRVDRLVLDSVVPQDGPPSRYEESLRRTGWMLRQACAERRCGFDPAAELATVVRRDGNGVGVFNLMIIASIVDPRLTGEGFYPVLDLLHRSAGGDPGPLDQAVDDLSAPGGTPLAQYSSGLHVATICADAVDEPWGSPLTPLERRDAAVARALSRVDPAAVWPFEPATVMAQGLVSACRYWPPSRPNPRPVTDRLTVPVLLLAGDRDLSTPLEWAQRQAARTPRGRLVVIPGMGHSMQGRNPDADAAVAAFLLGPGAAADPRGAGPAAG